MAHDVFISYTNQDDDIANAIVTGLEEKKIKCWLASRDIEAGSDYAEQIIYGIYNSHLLVLILSSKSNNSPHVLREVERAVSNKIRILPFRIEDVKLSASLEYYLSSQQWLDALTPPLEKHIERLAKRIQGILAAQKRVEIEQALASGKKAIAAGDYSQARKHFEEVLELDSENREALSSLEEIDRLEKERGEKIAEGLDLGKKALAAGDYSQARKKFEKVHNLDSENREALSLLEEIDRLEKERGERIAQLLASAKKLMGAGDYTRARKKFEKVHNLDSENREALSLLEEIDRLEKERGERIAEGIELGKEALAAGDYSQARKHFEEVLELDCENREALSSLEEIDRLEKERGEKIAEGLDLGKKALASGYSDQAKSFFKEVLKLDGKNREAIISLKEIDRLEEERKKEISAPPIDPGRARSRKTIGILVGIALSIVVVVAAVYLITRITGEQVAREEISEHLKLGQQALDNSYIRQAKQHFWEVINLDSENREALSSLEEIQRIEDNIAQLLASGKELMGAGDYTRARKRFEEVHRLDRENQEALSSIEEIDRERGEGIAQLLASAKQLMGAGDYSQARKHFEEVLNLDSENREALSSLEEIDRLEKERGERIAQLLASAKKLMGAGDYTRAKKQFRAVLKLDGKNKEALSLLARIEPFPPKPVEIALKDKKLEFYPQSPRSVNFGRIRKEGDRIEKVIRITSHLDRKIRFRLSDVELLTKVQLRNINIKHFFSCKELILDAKESDRLKVVLKIPPGIRRPEGEYKLPEGEYNGLLVFKDNVSDKLYHIPFRFLFKP